MKFEHDYKVVVRTILIPVPQAGVHSTRRREVRVRKIGGKLPVRFREEGRREQPSFQASVIGRSAARSRP